MISTDNTKWMFSKGMKLKYKRAMTQWDSIYLWPEANASGFQEIRR